MKTFLSAFLVLAVASGLCAQNKDSLWTTASLNSEIAWQVLASDGTLITANQEFVAGATQSSEMFTSLTGIDPKTGSVKWKYAAPQASYVTNIEFIPNTPFFRLSRGSLKVIDQYDGRVLVDLEKEGITEESHGYLLQSGHLWVSGTYKGDRCISLFDLTTGKKLWSNADLLKEKSKMASKLGKLGALTGSAVPNKEPVKLLGTPINHGNDKIIAATSNGIFSVNAASGETNWQAELPDPNKGKMVKVEVDINFLKLIPGADKFYVVKAAYITACSYADGRQLWEEPVKTSGPIETIIYDEKGLILCPGSANVKGMMATGLLQMVNEKTGTPLWGEGIKFNGGVKTYAYTDKGLAVVMVNSSSNKNSINIIDVAAGKFVLPKSVNLDGDVQYIELVPKGLLYKTDRTVNILSLDTDASLLSLPVQSKKDRAIVSANTADRFYFYSDEDHNLYEIDKAAGTGRQLNKSKIEFQGGELPKFIDVRREGVAVYSDQNITLIAPDGSPKYAVYHPGVQTVATAMQSVSNALDVMGAVVMVASAGNQMSGTLNGSPAGRNQYDQMNQAFASVGNAAYVVSLKQFGSINNRLKASAQSKDHVVMMTKVDGRPILVAINKDTGETGLTIPLARKDDVPLYLVDPVSGMLFYAPKGKNLLGWGTGKNTVSGFAVSR